MSTFYCPIKYLDVVKLLSEYLRVNSSDRNNVPIIRATKWILLNGNRVDPSGRCNLAIGYAAKNGYLEIVELLLNDKHVDPSVINLLE